MHVFLYIKTGTCTLTMNGKMNCLISLPTLHTEIPNVELLASIYNIQLYSLEVPNHWLRDFFYAEASLSLLLSSDALSYYNNLSVVGFSQSSYITAQLALANYHLKSEWAHIYTHTHTHKQLLYSMYNIITVSYIPCIPRCC